MTIDPVTLEILRHRLEIINEEQGLVAIHTSGSPIVYEAYDLNSSLLTPEGDALFVGAYVTRLSLSIHVAAHYILDRLRDNPGIADGDMFYTNDPWAGAIHMNDSLMVAPIFWEGRIVAWSGISMHEIDVGGPVPGGYGIGARDIFGESPLIPPVKLVERGLLRRDIEAWILRNTRTPELNALNIRARMAALYRARDRIHDIAREYGVETLLEAQREILAQARRTFARRLLELPDGTWRENGFLDHDGIRNRMYRFRLAMTKKADRLILDYRGCGPQAPAMVNCTRNGLEGGVMSAVLPTLCYDMPWSPGAIAPHIEILSKEGTIVHAQYPAGAGMGATGAVYVAGHLACATIAKMFACSDRYRSEAQANWGPSWKGEVVAGHRGNGQYFTANFLDQASGGGARTYKDGVDSGGLYGSPRLAIANVEAYERLYPVLYLFRRHCPDTAGPGQWRGGVGTEIMLAPHKTRGPLELVMLGHGATHPEAKGICGGFPSTVQPTLVLRHANLAEVFRKGQVPSRADDLQSRRVDQLKSKHRTRLAPDDVLVSVNSGGGGYGDPLERNPALVQRDVAMGFCSREMARKIYGVVLDLDTDHGIPALKKEETDALRTSLREARLATGKPADPAAFLAAQKERPPDVQNGDRLFSIGDAVEAVGFRDRAFFRCARCLALLGEARGDPKRYGLVLELPIEEASPWNRFALAHNVVLREFCCPRCGTLFGVQVSKRGDPLLFDTEVDGKGVNGSERT